MSQVSKSPEATDNTLGALTEPSFTESPEAAILLNTCTALVSMPLRLPSLSSNGTRIEILKLAIGEMVACILLLGSIYGSAGVMITELAIGVAGGKLNTEYLVLSTRAAARVALRVDIAVISRPCF